MRRHRLLGCSHRPHYPACPPQKPSRGLYTEMVPLPPWPPAAYTSEVAAFHTSAVTGVRGAPAAMGCTVQAESSRSTVYRPPVVATAAESAKGLRARRVMGLWGGGGGQGGGPGIVHAGSSTMQQRAPTLHSKAQHGTMWQPTNVPPPPGPPCCPPCCPPGVRHSKLDGPGSRVTQVPHHEPPIPRRAQQLAVVHLLDACGGPGGRVGKLVGE